MKRDLRDLFIPYEGNGYKPHFLRKETLASKIFVSVTEMPTDVRNAAAIGAF